uniref:Protein-glutamine gamma-glutamyltransferase 2 n=1 Tax=Hippocampus comes TaxID=109280 RepID=A0A3Q2XCA9_HIPCM
FAAVLAIERCDLNIRGNKSSHHTEPFADQRLIVRRGQAFTIFVHLRPGSKTLKAHDANLNFIVHTGPLPKKESDTKVSFPLSDSTVDTEWSASATHDRAGNKVSLTIMSSPNAPIGLYSLTVDHRGQKTTLGQFTLLFNAWCPNDAVYMHGEAKRHEYVLAQHGQIYRGTHKRIKGTPWNFGQFEAGILDICLKILDDNPKFVSDADQDCSARKNPIYVTRVLSAMINSNDDKGVLVGEWYDFTGGIHPGQWVGTGDILRQWAESGPVRYGQCWVFAAVGCTVSRALGIPCRVVTNFGSAHDSNANLIIENHYNEDGEMISEGDSVWNFHVWVDSWMTRPDLGKEFDGWQTSDPTPQEKSDGVYRCGPAALRAIKEGELTKKYDAPFIFAEVKINQGSSLELVKISGSTKSVGRFISTKAVASDERQDITDEYKYPEGSKEEREVYKKAQHHNKLQQRGEDPGLQLKIKLAKNMIVGSDFEVYAVVTNNCMVTKTCTLLFFAKAVGYNGRRGKSCGFTSDRLEVPAGEGENLLNSPKWTRIVQNNSLVAHLSLNVFVQMLGEAMVMQPVLVRLTMLNPLPEALLDCSFTVGGAGLIDGKPITLKYVGYWRFLLDNMHVKFIEK